MSRYWIDCIEAAFEEANITATKEQILQVAGDVETSHELYGQAHGYDCIPNPIQLENERLKRELDKEQRKRICKECKGKGYIVVDYGIRSSSSRCSKCNGEGKI